MRCYQAITATIFLAVYAVCGASATIPGDTLSCVMLEGFRDSQHAQRCVGFCDAKAYAVVFYSTPQDKEIVENTTACMNDASGKNSGPAIYYVLNRKGMSIPVKLLRHMLKNRSKKYPDITYCIDNEERLPEAWKLDSRHAHIVVLDSSSVTMFSAVLPLKRSECEELKKILAKIP